MDTLDQFLNVPRSDHPDWLRSPVVRLTLRARAGAVLCFVLLMNITHRLNSILQMQFRQNVTQVFFSRCSR